MKPKAIVLLSGGLDSSLALQLMVNQGIDLVVLHFTTIFCTCDKKGTGCGHQAAIICQKQDIPYQVIEMTKEYIPIVKNPRHGYGSGMNPCVDCRILMFSKAKQVMEQLGASFIVTGEVLAQRPMSQMRQTLRLIERESGLVGKILRPLSAQCFPPTEAEKQGLVDRQQLLDFTGRSRKPQIALAEQLGITEYPCAAGGCLLTDRNFAARLRDLFKYNIDNLNDIKLLMVGRHFRLSPTAKLIVGRNKLDNEQIIRIINQSFINQTPTRDYLFEVLGTGSPISLLRLFNGFPEKVNGYIELVASICARYSDQKNEPKVKVSHQKAQSEPNELLEIIVEPIAEIELSKLRI